MSQGAFALTPYSNLTVHTPAALSIIIDEKTGLPQIMESAGKSIKWFAIPVDGFDTALEVSKFLISSHIPLTLEFDRWGRATKIDLRNDMTLISNRAFSVYPSKKKGVMHLLIEQASEEKYLNDQLELVPRPLKTHVMANVGFSSWSSSDLYFVSTDNKVFIVKFSSPQEAKLQKHLLESGIPTRLVVGQVNHQNIIDGVKNSVPSEYGFFVLQMENLSTGKTLSGDNYLNGEPVITAESDITVKTDRAAKPSEVAQVEKIVDKGNPTGKIRTICLKLVKALFSISN